MSFLNVNQINTAGGLTSYTTGANTIGFTSGTQTYILGASSASTMKNRIINGGMVIDQRNAGASGTANGYTVDRWQYFGAVASKGTWQQNAGSVTPPTGYKNYLGFTSSSSYTVGASENFQIAQYIEGYNSADLGFGAAGASTVTLSFWVRSSLTGTFGGALLNSAANRSYPFTYTISVANTWEQKSVTIAGDTSGTWLTTTGVGIQVNFGLGVGSTYSGTAGAWAGTLYLSATGATSVVGTNGATFYITGVQLEVGSAATSFDYRHYGTELALCQRYYEKTYSQGVVPGTSTESNVEWAGTSFQSLASTGTFQAQLRPFKVVKRAAPTMTFWDMVGNQGKWTRYLVGGGPNNNNTVTVDTQDDCGFRMFVAGTSSTSNVTGHWTASSEL
jgi:hypothetical protein